MAVADWGITNNGFYKPSDDEVLEEVIRIYRDNFGDQIDTDPQTPMGQAIAIDAANTSKFYAQLQAEYNSKYPFSATGVNLDKALSAVGSKRNGAVNSTGFVIIYGDENTNIDVGYEMSVVDSPDRIFVTTSPATINQNIVDGKGDTGLVPVSSKVAGAIEAPSGTLTVPSPKTGVDSCNNPEDISVGANAETDPEAKASYKARLQQPGTSSVLGIERALEDLSFVSKATVVENDTDVEDPVTGIPSHAFEAFVEDGGNAANNQEIAETIFYSKPCGIQAHGDVVVTITDSKGIQRDIGFSRPTRIEIYVDAVVTVNNNSADGPIFPTGGLQAVEDAILAYGQSLKQGWDVRYLGIISAIMSVSGVIDVDLKVDTVFPPVGTTDIVIGAVEVAEFDSSRTEVSEAP